MEFILNCVKIGIGCACGVTAFMVTGLIFLYLLVCIAELGKEKNE